MADPLDFVFDVTTSLHDDVKQGVIVRRLSRVVLSDTDFPTPAMAADVACCMAVAIHGGMPTSVTRVN